MTSIGRVGGDGPVPPVFTGPVVTGIPRDPRVAGAVPPVDPVPPADAGAALPLPDIALAGRLAAGDVLPEAPALALALEQATRALQGGRAHEVLATLDATWSSRLAADSPWYLRAAALELLARRDDAAGVLRDALARLPRSGALLYLLGVHALASGDARAADVASEHAVALHPDDPVLLVLRAAIETHLGRTTAGDAHLARAAARAPSLPVGDWYAGLLRLAGAARAGVPAAPGAVGRPTRLATPASLRAIGAGDAAARDAAAAGPADRAGRALLRTPTPSTAMRAIGSAADTDRDPLRRAQRRPDDEAGPAVRADRSPVPEGLHDAVRYGLALLDPPGVAARAAVRHRTLDDAMPAIIAQAGLLPPPSTAPTVSGGAAVLVAIGVLALVLMPSPRTVLVLVAVGVVWAWWRWYTRQSAVLARDPLPERASTVDRRVG